MPKTERMIELMMRVYEKEHFTVEELAEEFGVSYRTMLRYLQELSGLGVPLFSQPGKNGGYSIMKNKAKAPVIARSAGSINRVIKPVTHVVGVELKAPFTAFYMAKAIRPQLWKEIENRRGEIQLVKKEGTFTGAVLSKNRIYHYIAGVEVARPVSIPPNMVSITLPAREYAVYTHDGDLDREEFDETYFYALEKLRKQGLNHDPDAYSLEIFKRGTGQEYTIYVPLSSD
ncbi:HTH domain-containing protein [Fictibacillus sp. Mic-4]|uniref:HTH domain-containing protein n=1 Tax=Fictibacillus sp. Mic-4 TaxID=3132826 RepID=UPI003CF3CAF7